MQISETYTKWFEHVLTHLGCHYGKNYQIVAENLARVAFPKRKGCPGPLECQRHAQRLARAAHGLADEGLEPAKRVAEKADCWNRLFERFIQTYGVPKENLADAVSSGQVSIEAAIEALIRV